AEEEAVDQRADRLAEAAAPRGPAARRAPVEGPVQGDPAAPRRPPQERAGRHAVRAARLHEPTARRLSDARRHTRFQRVRLALEAYTPPPGWRAWVYEFLLFG